VETLALESKKKVAALVKCRFWLLDINYELRDHKPEIFLWGIDDKGRHILIIDRNFLSYFYLVLNAQENPETVLERVRQKQAELPFVIESELTVRRLFGQPVYAVKVVCQGPDVIPEYVKLLSKVEGVEKCLEDDIRYSMRYLVDNDVAPCGWHEIEVSEEVNNLGSKLTKFFLQDPFPKESKKKMRLSSGC
jgi:DNA polymerase I